jgi:hypothetical protein
MENSRVSNESSVLSMQSCACRQAVSQGERRKRSAASRSWRGAGASSASNTAVNAPRSTGKAMFRVRGFVRGRPSGATMTS